MTARSTQAFVASLLCGITLFANTEGHAVTPLTPRLENTTGVELFAHLSGAGFPEVGQNSVAIGITSALGFQASDAEFKYELPYDHLPLVSVVSTKISEQCSRVEATATGRPGSAYKPTTVTGTYCLVGAALWKSSDQAVKGAPR